MGSVTITAESLRQRAEIIATFTKLVIGVQEHRTEEEFVQWLRSGLTDAEFAGTTGMLLIAAEQWLPMFMLVREERTEGIKREVAARLAEVRARSANDKPLTSEGEV